MRWRRRKERDQELDRELRSDLELEAAEHEASGLSPEEAHYAARRAFGNATVVKEQVREMWGWTSGERILQDVRYAARILLKNPGFTAVAVLSLALGIGANTSVFSVLDAVLLKRLPVSHPEQLRILTWIRHGGDPIGMKNHSGYAMDDERGRHVDGSFSWPAYELFRSTLRQFSDLVAFASNQFTVRANETSDLAFGHYVSSNYFIGLGVQPLIGRPILPEDDAPGRPLVAVLTHAYWKSRFGGDTGVVGRVILVNRKPVTVAGVMPPSFQGLLPGRSIDLFVPMSMVSESVGYYKLTQPDNWWVQIFGRLNPGTPEGAAAAAVQSALANHIASYTGSAVPVPNQPKIILEPGNRGVGLLRGSIRTTIYILAVIAGLVLLIACINLANLLLARYAARGREIAVRISIGASRGRLVRQMLTESLLLAGMGAVAGLLVAKPLLRLLIHFFSGQRSLGLDTRLDARTLGFTFAISILTALLFGTMPTWRATHVSPGPWLKQTSATPFSRSPRLWLGRYLVSIQIGLSLLLLVGTGLFLRTLLSLAAVDLGFQKENVLTFQTDPGRTGYRPPQLAGLYRQLEARMAALPGVEAVAMSHHPLIAGYVSNGPVRLRGQDKQGKQTWFLYCSDSFLSTMRIPILLGRDLTRADFDREIRSVVVNEAFVRKYLPGLNPTRQMFYGPDWNGEGATAKPFTIVGVAKDAHYEGVRSAVPPTAYVPYSLSHVGVTTMVFMIRTRLVPLSLASGVRQAVESVDRNLPIAEMRTEQDQIDRSLGTERLFATLVTTFGMIALILAAIGLYGVIAFSVSRRTSEIGIRMALGAQRGDVQWLVLRQSLLMAMWGILVGVPSALMLTSFVKKLLYGVKANDPASLAGAVMVMSALAAFSAWIPARRASRVDPMAALRHE